ncbi:MAG TPA: response regulator [Pyrinomonadaceae bacterium]|jgi:two-component system response regulator AtoC
MATILIVDDDNLVRDQLCELLSPSHECHTADRAEQALAYLDIETYDAVLTDIYMPGLSGRDLLKYIQAKHPTTPVIVITGMMNAEEETDGREYLNLGAFAFFNKPFKLEEIEDAVERAITRHRELARVAPSEKPTENEPPPDAEISS